jgi:hypothetical protein
MHGNGSPSGDNDRQYAEEEWLLQRHLILMKKRTERAVLIFDDSEPPHTSLEIVERWLIGAAQRLQTSKNLESAKPGGSASARLEKLPLKQSGTVLVNDAKRERLEKESYDALEEEVVIKRAFLKKQRSFPTQDTRPTKEGLLQQSKWMVDEMGLNRDTAAVRDKSWIWQMYCLLSKERRRLTTPTQYDAFMQGTVAEERHFQGRREQKDRESLCGEA